MHYNEKYLKYKKKYLNLKKQIGSGKYCDKVNKNNEEIEYCEKIKTSQSIQESNNINLFKIDSDKNKLINCIAVKSSAIITKGSISYIGDVGKKEPNIKYKTPCLTEFDEQNPPFCYLFISLEPELKDKLKKIPDINNKTELELSNIVKRILGLRPDWGPYTHVVKISTDVSNLFRPCHNNSSNNCNNDLSNNIEYTKWLNKFKTTSINEDIPFTGLGYTYDWSKDKPEESYGVSEYTVIFLKTIVFFKKIVL